MTKMHRERWAALAVAVVAIGVIVVLWDPSWREVGVVTLFILAYDNAKTFVETL